MPKYLKVMMRDIFVTKVMIVYLAHPRKFKLKTQLYGKGKKKQSLSRARLDQSKDLVIEAD
jgi:hypothetical protein